LIIYLFEAFCASLFFCHFSPEALLEISIRSQIILLSYQLVFLHVGVFATFEKS
jgi:hypothetical protein